MKMVLKKLWKVAINWENIKNHSYYLYKKNWNKRLSN